ncbi:MAG: glycogen/starch synthase, partial [Tidjanibacter sp.]|nr:glycogen/starch synthase [Tidjanibacter sp.]
MKNETVQRPDYLFEVSWEVCNKVGGIHTVVATKAQTVVKELGDKYILIGPDINREGANPEFEEDLNMLREWRQVLYSEGYRVRVGRWRIEGSPVVVLVDFNSLFARKDDILKFLWEEYKVDSISGQWDYIEPVIFGFAAGKVIESYINNFCSSTDRTVAHFHEWMTASGGLYLRTASPYTATVFSTHATVMGRCIAGNGLPLYSGLGTFNADDFARQFNVVAKHSLEKVAARNHDAFCTVSRITAKECKYLLGSEVDVVTPNGFEDNFVAKGKESEALRKESRKKMIEVAEACFGKKYDKEPLIVGTSGRYEFKNKGLDVFIQALKQVAANLTDGREVLAIITVPAGNEGPRRDLMAHLADSNNPIDANAYPCTTHYLSNQEGDPIVRAI